MDSNVAQIGALLQRLGPKPTIQVLRIVENHARRVYETLETHTSHDDDDSKHATVVLRNVLSIDDVKRAPFLTSPSCMGVALRDLLHYASGRPQSSGRISQFAGRVQRQLAKRMALATDRHAVKGIRLERGRGIVKRHGIRQSSRTWMVNEKAILFGRNHIIKYLSTQCGTSRRGVVDRLSNASLARIFKQ